MDGHPFIIVWFSIYVTLTTFLFIGKDTKRKNLPLVIEAFQLLHEKNPSYRLIVAGSDSLSLNVPGIEDKGLVPFSTLPDLYNQSDVFVMPSRFEAYGLVFGEAFAYGLPCIGNDRQEMPYFIEEGKTGYLLRHQNAQELASLMEKAISNTTMKEEEQSRQSEYIREYSWDTVIDRMVAKIEDVTRNP